MKTTMGTAFALFFGISMASVVQAADAYRLLKAKRTSLGLYMDSQQAYDAMKKNGDRILFLDVRTRAEVNFLGMPQLVDANVPFMLLPKRYAFNGKQRSFRLVPNGGFEKTVAARLKAKGLDKGTTIILLSRSGVRSALAASHLAKLGYKKVYSVTDGYEGDKVRVGMHKGMRLKNGWKNAGLPWSYRLDRSKMYQVGR